MKTISMRRLAVSVAVLLVAVVAEAQQATALGGEFNPRWHRLYPGSDIALTGRAGWNTIPVAFSRGDGTFQVTNRQVGAFAIWAADPQMTKLTGDFDGDRQTDIALVALSNSIPVALSNGNGSFRVVNGPAVNFGGWAAHPLFERVAADFNGDQLTDIALVGSPPTSWTPLGLLQPFAYSNGDGTFSVVIEKVLTADTLSEPGARKLYDDFDGDGKDDIALLCGPSFGFAITVFYEDRSSCCAYLPSAFSSWDIRGFTERACAPGATMRTGDFDADGRADIAAIGSPDSPSVQIAFSGGRSGTFTVVDPGDGVLAAWASDPATKVFIDDFDGDGLSDLALLGQTFEERLPVAFSNGDGSFRLTAEWVGDFTVWAAGTGVQRVVGDYDNDGDADIALTGGIGWNTLPVAFSNGDGTFNVTNAYIGSFATWAAP